MENKYYKLKRNIIVSNNKLLRSKTLIMKKGTKIYKRTLFTEEFVNSLNLKPEYKKLFIRVEWDVDPKTGDTKDQIVNSLDSIREVFKDEYGNVVVQKSNAEVEELSGRSINVDNSKLKALTTEKQKLEKSNAELLNKLKQLEAEQNKESGTK